MAKIRLKLRSISEPEAEVAVGEMVEAVTQIEAHPTPAYPAGMKAFKFLCNRVRPGRSRPARSKDTRARRLGKPTLTRTP